MNNCSSAIHCHPLCVGQYCIAGNFCEVQIFAIFATHDQNAKIRTAKISTPELLREKLDSWKFSHMRFVHYSLARSDDGAALLFQTSRRSPTVSHRRFFGLC